MIPVDTHVVVWLAFDQTQLSKNARAAIDDARRNGDGLAISDITMNPLERFQRLRKVTMCRSHHLQFSRG